MTRLLICIFLLAITGLTQIALADATSDARKTLGVALKQAVSDIVKKGETDRQTIASLAMDRTQTEWRQFYNARVTEGVRRGQKRSDAETDAKDEAKEMLDDIIQGSL